MEEFAEKRMKICEACAIMKSTSAGPKCDNQKWLNPETNESSVFFKDGWIKGCGCLLKYKTTNENNHCPAKKW